MKKEKLDGFLELQEEIENEAMDLLKWYNDNIHPIEGYGDNNFAHYTVDYIECNRIYYEGYAYGEDECADLPVKLLFVDREEYKKNYLGIKRKNEEETWRLKKEKDTQNKAKKIQGEIKLYQELHEKYKDKVNWK